MLLRFGKLYCLGDDLMLVEHLGQQVQIDPCMVQQWSRRIQGVGFRRLVLVGVPSVPEADFSCRTFDRNGNEVDSSFVDLCCVASFLHSKRLTNQPRLHLQARQGCIHMRVRDDGWVSADYLCEAQPAGQLLPPELLSHFQQVSQRHELELSWQVHGKQLAVWAGAAPPQRLHRLVQPVVRELRGWQLLWLHMHDERVRVHGWQAADADLANHDPARLIAGLILQNLQLPAVQVEWQQDCLLLEFVPERDRVQMCARAWPVYEGQIHL